MAPADDLLGSTLGNFRIVRMLGRGGMGVVYLGEHVIIGSKVAVKFLHPHLAGDRTLVERFFAEARAANLIGHENIVNIFDLSVLQPSRYYLVMEYLEGRPLSALQVPLDPAIAIPILVQACDALQAAHAAGVVHRDLKPENVFLVRRGNNENFVKLVDFGIAKLGEVTGRVTAAGLTVGTPEYMSPEQWGGQEVDGRSDLYALGIIAYGLATGRLPFRESTPLAYYLAHCEKKPPAPRELNPTLSPAYEEVILKALAKDREQRFRDAQEMRAALQAVLEAPPAAPACPSAPTPKPFFPRHAATLKTTISWPGLQEPRQLQTADLSRAGMFVCAEAPLPALFARVQLAIQHGEGEVRCEGEVVRHVSAEQARAWGMAPGFAVQFVDTSDRFRRAIERLLQGRPPSQTPRPASVGDDPEAAKLIDFYRKRISGDHYALLGLAGDAECSEIRHMARLAARELEALRSRSLSPTQRGEVEAALERVNAAVAVLGAPAKRAEYDANRGNFRGAARCLAAGLSASDLEALRRVFIASHAKNESLAAIQLAGARGFLAAGQEKRALEALETALTADPLNLELHQRYWALRRKLAQGGQSYRSG